MKSTEADPARRRYRRQRIDHWQRVSDQKARGRRASAYYHRLLAHYYRFLIPSQSRVLELGCGNGDLLAAVDPSFGVGVDFSGNMLQHAVRRHPQMLFVQADAHAAALRTTFDFIILSDLINDLWDVQTVLQYLGALSHSRTRLVMNYFSNLWRVPLAVVRWLGLGADTLEQNWLSPQDVANLLELTGFEVVRRMAVILLPLPVPVVARAVNQCGVHLWPLKTLALTNFMVARRRAERYPEAADRPRGVSVVVPARNEAGNIETVVQRIPQLGQRTEIIFVEGGSQDDTLRRIEDVIARHPDKNCRLLRQGGRGKGDAVRLGFSRATGEMLMILDADMTVPPEDLVRFYEALAAGQGDFINGVRLVYPFERESMRFLNMVGNKLFSMAFTWLLGQPLKDTLCGTKVLWRRDYQLLERHRGYFGDFDPFGDFDLLFGAAKLNLKIVEIPVRYRARTYGQTNIARWRHGWLLYKMVVFAARRIKFI